MKNLQNLTAKILVKKNIKTSIIISHNKNINDYSKHISALKAAGGDALAIISSVNLGGDQIINSIIDTGMFDIFILSENMIDEEIVKNLRKIIEKIFWISSWIIKHRF